MRSHQQQQQQQQQQRPAIAISPLCSRGCQTSSTPTTELDVRYIRLRVLGEGTYGIVYEAIHVPSGTKVALKKLRNEENEDSMEQTGLPTTAIRETVLLR